MSSRAPMTLRRRLALTLVAAGVVLTAVILTAVVLLLQVRSLQDEVVDDYFRSTTLSADAFVLALDIEAGLQAYALTGDRSALEPLQRSRSAQQRRDGEELLRRVSQDAGVLAAFQRAQQSASEWFAGTAQPLIAQVQAGGPQSLRPGQAAEVEQRFRQVRDDYAAFRAELIDVRGEVLEDLEDRTAGLFAVVLGSAVVAAGVAGLAALLTRRWVTTPLEALALDVRTVHAGQLDHRIAPVGPPEIRAVAGDVDDMRGALVWRLAEVEQAARDIEAARVKLEEQADELARSNRDLEQFAYVASHDLQEPLRKVASFCQLLQRRYGGQLDERADQYIEFAVDGAKRMQQLINDLLSFSRVGRMAATEMTLVPLEGALERATASLSTALEESGAVVTADPLPEVYGEPTLLAQLLQNLIGNAVKFRGDALPRVRITCEQGEDAYALAVRDNGIGIEPQYAERVFVIFQRLHPKEAYEGTGIGLALCKRIVEHHGGRIWIESPPGGGTTVRFTLPRPGSDETSLDSTSDSTQDAPQEEPA